jgi:hypothetical protein
MALVFGANPSAAAAASPVSARLASTTVGLHLTSARAPQRSTSSPRSDRSTPSRHPASRPHPAGGTARAHQTASRSNRNPHGRGNGHAAAIAVLDDLYYLNTSTQVEAAWLRAPRRSFTAAPETRGPPRASPMTNSRPHPSPERPSDVPSRFGRAPSQPQTLPTSSLHPDVVSMRSLCRAHRDWPLSHPHARRFEGAAAWYATPSGGVLS